MIAVETNSALWECKNDAGLMSLPTVRASLPAVTRQKIMRLQADMMAAEEAQIDCPPTHHFAPGVYAREITIPEGGIVVGKIHKHAHLNVVSKGRCLVASEFGPMEIQAPHTWMSQPGIKRVILALEETVWTTIHPTDETDLEKIEDAVIAKNYEEFDAMKQIKESL